MMKKRETLPILLKEQKILLIGAGEVALQKAKVLFENNITFSVIATNIHPKMSNYCTDIQEKTFVLSDIGTYFIVIDATGDEDTYNALLSYKKTHTLLLNVVDKPQYCDFYFMALTKNKPLQVAVSSNGASPTAAQYFRDKFQSLMPTDIDAFMQEVADKRKDGIIDPKAAKEKLTSMQTRVYLVGCGLGDPELLTIKAYNIIQSVDVVLYDHLISEEIMDIVPSKTERVFVGKEKGFHTKPQDEINTLILSYVGKGQTVARLKSGDPFIFGRGAEELLYLNTHNIKAQVIPGISSAIAAPLLANIPLTSRDISSSFTVVSAHLKDSSMNVDWVEQLKYNDQTIVVLMGLSRTQQIQEAAKKCGIDENKACAIVSNASRGSQDVITTTLKNLSVAAQKAKRPAIIIFGDVVKYPEQLKEIV
jgi:uroporphyrin-III C-methyltransferase/precorrin-2 dehydrogenase/sirohydrochlorin ferrochelatase